MLCFMKGCDGQWEVCPPQEQARVPGTIARGVCVTSPGWSYHHAASSEALPGLKSSPPLLFHTPCSRMSCASGMNFSLPSFLLTWAMSFSISRVWRVCSFSTSIKLFEVHGEPIKGMLLQFDYSTRCMKLRLEACPTRPCMAVMVCVMPLHFFSPYRFLQ